MEFLAFVVQVNLMNPSQTEKRPITADAALMNPVAKILALRSGENLQVMCFSVSDRLALRWWAKLLYSSQRL